jgi:hypothetical protein
MLIIAQTILASSEFTVLLVAVAELVRLVAGHRRASRDLRQLVGRHFGGNSLSAEASYPDFYPCKGSAFNRHRWT